ncbi:MAG TPA: 16S rRNA (cytosine(1402)-N(4))-methyltransferase RsmH [Bacilli bacterium]|nr:16S rRNA (cytosine(1402)-N(4))-methyltransferase RsmH [Bacilli bacterium]
MDIKEEPHKRRIRYKGTHPKTFETKYKELQPNKYADTITKVIQKGNTPAGMHRPICVNEILEVLNITSGERGLDATLGFGGHSLEILKSLNHTGHLYATDVDPLELPRTKERLNSLGYGADLLTVIQTNFVDIDIIVLESGPLNFILADLGVSSMQIDNPKRGFTFKQNGPLDLRMNPNSGIPASELLTSMTKNQLEEMFVENADEPHAEIIAANIVAELYKGNAIATTTELRNIIKKALNFLPKNERNEEIKKTCQRCFQALRIEVNNELGILFEFLEKIPDCLAPGGRVAILSFHSGEDRLVKKAFQHYYRTGVFREVARTPILPSIEECNTNSRARSAKLRWAIKA